MTLNVGIAGITGKFARTLVDNILQYPDTKIIGYCRNASKVSSDLRSNPRVEIREGDAYDAAKLRTFVKGTQVVVCCFLGDDELMIEGQKALIDACEEEGVARYVAGDWCLDYTKLELGELFRKDPMIHVKAYAETKKQVKGVHILIGAFMDTILSPFAGHVNIEKKTLTYWGTGDDQWEGTSYDNAAEFTAAVIHDENAVGVQRFVGGYASTKQLAKDFDEILGVKLELQRLGSLDELYEHMHDMQRKNPDEAWAFMSLFYTYFCLSGRSEVGPHLQNDKYPNVQAKTWEDFMKGKSVDQVVGAYSFNS